MLLALLLAVSLNGDAGEVAPGTTIVAIRIVEHDVFDVDQPGTSTWPYRWANALHVMTRERFIRSLLLFRVGDAVDPARLAETERTLRDTGFLSPVDITARPVPGGAEIVVETHDQWTTEVGFSYGRFGGQQHAGFSLAEQNLLGWGKTVILDLDSNPERTKRTVIYKDPLLLGSRWQLQAAHVNATDGSGDSFGVQYPFFALATPRAAALAWSRGNQHEWLWASGDKVVEGDIRTSSFQLWGGIRLPGGGETTDRLRLGIFADRASYANWRVLAGGAAPTPDSRDLRGILIGFEQQVDRWKVVRGFRAWQRQEDVALGPNWTAQVGVSLPAFGGDRGRIALAGDVNAAWLRGGQLSWADLSLAGRAEGGGLANTVTHVEVGTARPGDVGWRARLAADVGRDLDLDQQLALGADTGLRGWDPMTFDGTSRAVANLEWRHRLTGEVLHLGIIGLTVFGDAGQTWAPRVGPSTDGIRKDAGAGLLIESTRAAILRVVRLEVAFPDRGGKPLFLATSTSLF